MATMKSSSSALNPYAQSYVPLAKREVNKEDEDCKTLPREPAVSDVCPAGDDLKLKGEQVNDPHGVPSPHELDSKSSDVDSEMDLAYLQMMFPGVSDQSLTDVYDVNRGDLEAAIDMLNDLESADNLPDALDIGDAQQTVPPGECSSVKGLNVSGESSTSSVSSDLAVAT